MGAYRDRVEQLEREKASLQEAYDIARADIQKLSKMLVEMGVKCKKWEFDAKKWASELGEKRILAKLQECERCPREDTHCCKECVDPMEGSLRKVLDREAKRIGG